MQTNKKTTLTPKVYALPHLGVTVLFFFFFAPTAQNLPPLLFSFFKAQLKCCSVLCRLSLFWIPSITMEGAPPSLCSPARCTFLPYVLYHVGLYLPLHIFAYISVSSHRLRALWGQQWALPRVFRTWHNPWNISGVYISALRMRTNLPTHPCCPIGSQPSHI